MMDGLLAVGGLALVSLAALFLWAGRRRPQSAARRTAIPLTPQAQLRKLERSGLYWGVKVEARCRASSRLAGREYTFTSPPMVPVTGCAQAQCTCTLIGLPERRKAAERRSGFDRRQALRVEGNDRRSALPRRGSDNNSWVAYGHL